MREEPIRFEYQEMVGLLINFGTATLRQGGQCIVNALPASASPREPTLPIPALCASLASESVTMIPLDGEKTLNYFTL
jgi:hypothetical protein